MNIIWGISCVVLLSSVTLAQLNHFNVTYTDMDEPMQTFIAGEALVLLSKEQNPRAVAEGLVDILNKQYGQQWNAISGNNTNIIGLKFMKNTTLEFTYKTANFLIGKQQQIQQNSENDIFQPLIEKARISPTQTLFSNNSTKLNELTAAAKKILSVDHVNCKTPQTTYIHWCFWVLSDELFKEITKQNIFEGSKYSTTVGMVQKFYTYLPANDTYYFLIGDFYFSVMKL